MIESAATNGWDFRTKESAVNQRPKLTVDWSIPSTDEFQVLNSTIFHGEGSNGDTTAVVEVARLGSLSGAASVSYTVAAGSAGAGDFVADSAPLISRRRSLRHNQRDDCR